MSDRQNLSIAICTYNRCAELRTTLSQLASSSGDLIDGDEIIVVDNNSSDSTAAVVREYQANLPMIYVFEPSQGLSAARNAALNKYSTSRLIFIDDDISVTRQTISAYRRAFKEFPQYDFFGGRIEVDWGDRRPDWLQSDSMPLISGLIGHYKLPQESVYSSDLLLPYGANFAITRRLIDAVGQFDERLGVSGTAIARGEETDYFQRAMQAGLSGRYLDQALVFHRFQTERLGSLYLYRYGIAKGRAQGSRRSYAKAARLALKALWQLAKGRVDRYYQTVINVGIAMAAEDNGRAVK